MKKLLLMVIVLVNSISLNAEDAGKIVALEITGIPNQYDGKYGMAQIYLDGGERPRVNHRIFGTMFSGELKFTDGTAWTADMVEKNVRYQVILVIVDRQDDSASITKYSRRFLIDSDVVSLNFDLDFFDSPYEALQRYSPLRSKLPEEKLWALALTGFLTTANHDQHDLLGFNDINESNKTNYSNLLKRDWGINNRDELLATIQNTETNGHAGRLRQIKQIIQETIDGRGSFSIIAVNNKYHLDSRNYNYLKFVVLNWDRFNNRSIQAWDLGRVIALCRWGYSAGFLTEEEAWEKIMYYARKIQPLYESWEEYGYDYYMGRIFWASGFGDDVNYLHQTDKLYKDLTGEQGYWRNFIWNQNLGE
ncbi:MAG: DUF1266 domain-containing protein [Treponema sp.]|jgi:hypothetical protein|nr:DUF1266 domain-containing protein [Treponema sp.]